MALHAIFALDYSSCIHIGYGVQRESLGIILVRIFRGVRYVSNMTTNPERKQGSWATLRRVFNFRRVAQDAQ